MSNYLFDQNCGFTVFHKKTERVNWRNLANVDIDRVVRDNDVGVLRDNLKNIAFCDVDNELDLKSNDRTLVKMFKLSQLMIDYLLTSQNYLVKELADSEDRHQSIIKEIDIQKKKQQDCSQTIHNLKKECHRRKQLILAQQQIMDSGPNSHHRCPYCEKSFLNASYLRCHLEKRHADRIRRNEFEWNFYNNENYNREGSPVNNPQMSSRLLGSGRNHDVNNDEKFHTLQQRYEMEIGVLKDQNWELKQAFEQMRHRSPHKSPPHSPRRSNFGSLKDDYDGGKGELSYRSGRSTGGRSTPRRESPKRNSPGRRSPGRKSPGMETLQAHEARDKALQRKKDIYTKGTRDTRSSVEKYKTHPEYRQRYDAENRSSIRSFDTVDADDQRRDQYEKAFMNGKQRSTKKRDAPETGNQVVRNSGDQSLNVPKPRVRQTRPISPSFPDNVENRKKQQECRIVVSTDLDEQLKDYGIEKDIEITDQLMKEKMALLEDERLNLSRKNPEFQLILENLIREVEEKADYIFKNEQRSSLNHFPYKTEAMDDGYLHSPRQSYDRQYPRTKNRLVNSDDYSHSHGRQNASRTKYRNDPANMSIDSATSDWNTEVTHQ